MIAELGGTQFDNFESRLDGESDLTGRALRRTNLPRAAFGRADDAEPETSGSQCRRNLYGKTRPLFGFIEDMKAAAIKDEMEWTTGRGGDEKIQCSEAATKLRPSSFAMALSTASGATSIPKTSKPRSASQRAFVPVPAPISSIREGRMRPEVTNSTSSGSGSPVSQGRSPAA